MWFIKQNVKKASQFEFRLYVGKLNLKFGSEKKLFPGLCEFGYIDVLLKFTYGSERIFQVGCSF